MRYFIEGVEVPSKVAVNHYAQCVSQHGMDMVEANAIWKRANRADGEEDRDMVMDLTYQCLEMMV